MIRFIIILCGVALLATACSSRYYMKRGNVIYETGRFYKAASKYEKSYHKAKPKEYQANAAILAGQANENVGRLKEAYMWYRKAERANKDLPEVYLKIAKVCVGMNQMETAEKYYRQYEELFGKEEGKDGLYYLEQIGKDMKEEGRYMVQLKKELNSRNNDFAPVYDPEDTCVIYLASTRNPYINKKKSKINPVTGDGYSHIFKTEYVQEIKSVGKNGAIKVKRFKEPRWLQPVLQRDSLYSSRDEGGMCFSDAGELYFTSSRMVKGSNCGTRIYKATKESGENEDGTDKKGWTMVKASGICGDSVSVGHPALSVDGGRLYFATDALAGGMGGKDIWYVEAVDGKWSDPVNAGELINTTGDEMFPTVRENGEFYFASNGHYGFGGLDLYKVVERDGQPELFHLPAPLNSYADDFGIVFKRGQEDGLLTSTRLGRGDKIFSFSFIPQQLQVKLLAANSITERPISKVMVTVTADDGAVSYLETDSTGMTAMEVTADKEYVFVAEHPNFLKGKGMVSTYREKTDRLYELILQMQPIEKPIVIPNIYFDVAKWDLRPDAMENLKELLQILQDNPNITIELSAHTDMVGNDLANKSLSENRAHSVVDYLIEKGIYWDRLVAKGYGETQPRLINEKDVREYAFLKVGDLLNQNL
ncbi:MAG: OmpA family protein, partial [Odoribacter sp.]